MLKPQTTFNLCKRMKNRDMFIRKLNVIHTNNFSLKRQYDYFSYRLKVGMKFQKEVIT